MLRPDDLYAHPEISRLGAGFAARRGIDNANEALRLVVAHSEEQMRGPRAENAHYDADRNRVVVRLTTGVEVGFAPADVEGLENASAEERGLIEVQELGLEIHFPKLDADLYVPALLEGALGSKRWMAARLGAAGGRTRSPAKAAASRENGKRGGRPRKTSG